MGKHPADFPAPAFVALALAMLMGTGMVHASSLNEFVRQATQNHPRLLAATENVRASEMAANAAKGVWRPQVSASSLVGQTQSALSGATTQGFQPGISVSQLLFDGGRSDYNIGAREKDTEASAAQKSEQTHQLVGQLTESYLEWHRQRRLLELGDEQLVALDRFERMVSEIASLDGGRRSDLTLVKNRILQVSASRDARLLGANDLVMQLQLQCACRLTPTSPPPSLAGFIPSREPVATPEQLARDNPTVLGAKLRRDSALADANAAAAWYKPSVELVLNAQTESDFAGNKRYFGQQMIGVNVKASLYDGQTANAKAESAWARVQAGNATLDAALADVESESRRHWLLIEQRQSRIEKLKAMVQNADAAYELVFELFKIGRRSIIDLLAYENERFQARSQVISEEVDLQINRAKWLSALGKLTASLGRTDH